MKISNRMIIVSRTWENLPGMFQIFLMFYLGYICWDIVLRFIGKWFILYKENIQELIKKKQLKHKIQINKTTLKGHKHYDF